MDWKSQKSDDLVARLRASVTQARALDRSALLKQAADEIEYLREAIDNIGECEDQMVWRSRDENVLEMVSTSEWIVRASKELTRLRGVIDTYADICKSSAREIQQMRSLVKQYAVGQPDSDDVTDSLPE